VRKVVGGKEKEFEMSNTVTKKSFTKRTIFVCVTQALARKIHGLDPSKISLEDCARGYWCVSVQKASQCEWLMAVKKGEIVGAWEIDQSFGWRVASVGSIPTRKDNPSDYTRYYCKVNAAPALRKFIGVRMKDIAGIGGMNRATRYSF